MSLHYLVNINVRKLATIWNRYVSDEKSQGGLPEVW